MAMTDSLTSLSRPSKCRSTMNRKKRDRRSLREKPALARIRCSCSRAACMLGSIGLGSVGLGSVGAMALSIHLIFKVLQVYETPFRHSSTCFYSPGGACLGVRHGRRRNGRTRTRKKSGGYHEDQSVAASSLGGAGLGSGGGHLRLGSRPEAGGF